MDEFKNNNFENENLTENLEETTEKFADTNSEEEVLNAESEEPEYVSADEVGMSDFDEQTEGTVKNKKRYKLNRINVILSSALIVCLTVCTAFGFALYKNTSGNKSGTTYHASDAGQTAVKATSNAQFVPDGSELTTTEIAAKVGPSVVGVVCTSKTMNYFGQQGQSQSSGSGVIITDDGYIVTNNHVIENANSVKVVLNSGNEYDATVVGSDSKSDLAVLKIEEKGLTYATFGDSSKVMVGDKAVAIGNPLGTELMGTVTQGIISAVNRTVTIENKKLTLLQTDAAINSGNSGGALVNAYGEVIGINSAKMSAAGVEGIGFSIPSNTVKPIIDDLIKNGYVSGRLMIGVAGTNITETLADYYDLPEGFYVNQVYQGYGAYLAGIQPGDVIIKCDGKVTKTIDEINEIRDKHKVGDTITITVSRDGKTMDFNVKLMEENPKLNTDN